MKKCFLNTSLTLAMAIIATTSSAQQMVRDGNFDASTNAWFTNYNNMIGNWGVTGTSGKSLNLSYGGIAGCDAFQAIDMSAYKSAVLTFDLTTIAHGPVHSSYLAVSVGYDNEVVDEWFGSPIPGKVTTQHFSILINEPNAFMPNTIIDFAGANEDGSHTNIYVDNVSLLASTQAVPEPAPIIALGLGSLVLLRRKMV